MKDKIYAFRRKTVTENSKDASVEYVLSIPIYDENTNFLISNDIPELVEKIYDASSDMKKFSFYKDLIFDLNEAGWTDEIMYLSEDENLCVPPRAWFFDNLTREEIARIHLLYLNKKDGDQGD